MASYKETGLRIEKRHNTRRDAHSSVASRQFIFYSFIVNTIMFEVGTLSIVH